MTAGAEWHFWIDRGGTFTDVVARSPAGKTTTLKLLSDNPEHYDDAALEAIRRLTGHGDGPVPTADIRIGTTIATNALLERKGEPVLLAITRGFGDALAIGTQERGDIFALNIAKPKPLPAEILEIDERLAADGAVVRALDEQAARAGFMAARQRGIKAVAICLMHGYRYSAHEERLAALAREAGFCEVAVSHEVSPLARLIGRADCTALDAYLSPVLEAYTAKLAHGLGADNTPLFMQSNGGLTQREHFRGKDAVLSGPAGGIVGMAETSRAAGYERVIGFDMGGTSTDVSLYAGHYERSSDNRIDGVRIRVPMMRIHTIAAGGGSICHFDGARMQVGPESAGAQPGPACYQQGGPLTITDCNLLLGKLQAAHFPALFGPDGDAPLSRAAALARMEELLAAMPAEQGGSDGAARISAEQAAEGFITIASAAMANAVRAVSVAKGHDVEDFALACFGGAGGQHACLVAAQLGIKTVLVHRLSGVLSAYGMGLAVLRELREETLSLALADPGAAEALSEAIARLSGAARAALVAQGARDGGVTIHAEVHLRSAASDSTIAVAPGSTEAMASAFAAAYEARFGYASSDALVIDSIRVEASAAPAGADETNGATPSGATPSGASPSGVAPAGAAEEAGAENRNSKASPDIPAHAPSAPAALRPLDLVSCYMAGAQREAPVYARNRMAAGEVITGPALISDPVAMIVVEPGWQARLGAADMLVLTQMDSAQDSKCEAEAESERALAAAAIKGSAPPAISSNPAPERADPVRLEIFAGLFMAIAEEMGAALQHSAASVNIRERLDFSCALFDARGALIANAPHMPVHLGSMGDSVRAVIAAHKGAMQPGDAFALNAPWRGGTHLPDITVIAPVFLPGQDAPAWYVAARGHHADIGGIAPGSMPADSTCLAEEGIVLDSLLIRRGGALHEAALRQTLASGPYPARNIDQNIADIAAQLAACNRGEARLLGLAERYGAGTLSAYMEHLQSYSAAAVSRLLAAQPGGSARVESDNGAVIAIAVRCDAAAGRAVIDFTGSSAQLPGNFNAPSPVVRAACLYVIRTLIDTDIPMNDGFLRPVEIIIPPHSMLAPGPEAAVVAGNVETSQLMTDGLLAAFGALAASQGTMNNFTFGDAMQQYYETIAGGAGAGHGFAGADAVQTHMTNSRLTDPEILELRFPVRVEGFAIRRGSGGAGAWHGGDGTWRRLRFLAPMRAQILSNRRLTRPFGLAGGGEGACGVNRIIRAGGAVELLGPCAAADMAAGDCFEIETPGGGGFGRE